MVGRPRQDRGSIKAVHLSIRLTEKEVAALDALVPKADAQKAHEYAERQKAWDKRPESIKAKLLHTKPKPPRPTTYADIVRALLQQEVQQPRLYEKSFWSEFRDDTAPLDRLVDLANEKSHDTWTRETMLRRLVENEFGRRRLRTGRLARGR
jgi:hypothetical protein